MSRQREVDLGIDAFMARKMRNAILSDEPLPPSGRSNREHYREWDKDALIEYGRWLCCLLELEPGRNDPITQDQWGRASKLNIGPSEKVVENVLPDGHSELKHELGFRTPLKFRLLSRNDIVRKGKAMTIRLGHRPTRDDLRDAYERGRLPSERQLRKRFGTITNFHEFIGYPSVWGWSEDDYIDWGIAVRRQNPLEDYIGWEGVQYFSHEGVGPSDPSLTGKFGSFRKFNARVEEEYITRLENDVAQRMDRMAIARELVGRNESLAEAVKGLDVSEYLQAVGQYRLQKHIGVPVPESKVVRASLVQPDNLARWLVQIGAASSIGYVETAASILDVYDDLWPTYRFQNVDLRLPEAA